MIKTVRNFLAGAALLALGACQTTGPSAGVTSKLQAAGYVSAANQIAPQQKDVVISPIIAFGCSEKRCGAASAVGFADVTFTGAFQGVNIETLFRDQEMDKILKRLGASPETVAGYRMTLTSVRASRSTQYAGAVMQIKIVSPTGTTTYGVGRLVFHNASGRGILAVSTTLPGAKKAYQLALDD